MDLAEQQRGLSSGNEHDRALFFSSFTEVYETMFAWQVELGNYAAAFDTLERSRARALNDLLKDHPADLLSHLPARESQMLLQRERESESAKFRPS